jgi:hypothetical protein
LTNNQAGVATENQPTNDFDMSQPAPATASELLEALAPVDPLYACCDPHRSGSGMHQSWQQ